MKVILFILILISVLTPVTAATSDSYVIPLTDPVYGEIDALYISQGLSTASSSRPWSRGEASIILSRLSGRPLNEHERRLFDAISNRLDGMMRWSDDDVFSFGAAIDASLEGYAHTNTEDFTLPQQWLRGFEERKPLLKLRLDGSVDDVFYTYCDLQYGMGKVTKDDTFVSLTPENGMGFVTPDGYVASYKMDSAHMLLHSAQYSSALALNVPAASALFDFVWPKRAMISLSGAHWNLQFGRDRIETGISRAGSLLLDDHSDWNDHFTLSFFSNRFKYTWRNVFLNGIIPSGEKAVTESRIFMIHTLEFRPFENLSLMISEDLMYRLEGGQAIDFSFFNPAYIYHNLNNRSIFNAIAYLEVKWVPAKCWEINSQFVLDQATAPNEDDSQQASWGASLGAVYSRITGNGVLTLYGEGVYTTPLLYRRDEVDFVKVMRYFHLTSAYQTLPDGTSARFGSNALSFEYLGFRYGGDAIFLTMGGEYSVREKYKAEASISLLVKGEMNIFRSHNRDGLNAGLANYAGTTPSGSVTNILMASSSFEYDFSSHFGYPGVTAGAELDWIGILTPSFSQDLQLSVYATVTL